LGFNGLGGLYGTEVTKEIINEEISKLPLFSFSNKASHTFDYLSVFNLSFQIKSYFRFITQIQNENMNVEYLKRKYY
jgi:hypothetical protein